MKTRPVERPAVLLSLQRALLGEVFPALRAVSVEWSDRLVEVDYEVVRVDVPKLIVDERIRVFCRREEGQYDPDEA